MISGQFFFFFSFLRESTVRRERERALFDCFQVSGLVKMQNVHLALHRLAASESCVVEEEEQLRAPITVGALRLFDKQYL